MIKRELAIVTGKRKSEIELSCGDLVWIIAPNFAKAHDQYCFFKNTIFADFVELEHIDGTNMLVPLNMIGGLEVVARKDTRQYEILVDLFLQNNNLNKRIEQIEKNFAQLLCKQKNKGKYPIF